MMREAHQTRSGAPRRSAAKTEAEMRKAYEPAEKMPKLIRVPIRLEFHRHIGKKHEKTAEDCRPTNVEAATGDSRPRLPAITRSCREAQSVVGGRWSLVAVLDESAKAREAELALYHREAQSILCRAGGFCGFV